MLLGGLFYIYSIVLSDHLSFRQGSLPYAIVVTSDAVRDFPRFAAAGDNVDFTYDARDGTAPGVINFSYASGSTLEDLRHRHARYCRRRGYDAVPQDGLLLASQLGCEAPDYRIEVALEPSPPPARVTVFFLEK